MREFGGDIPVRAVLDELLHIGSAALLPTATSSCAAKRTSPPTTRRAIGPCSARDPAELFGTIVHNIEHPDAAVAAAQGRSYDHIGADALPALREEARQAGLDFVRRANALLASYDRDRIPTHRRARARASSLGVYYFEEPVAPEYRAGSAAPPPRPPGRIRRKS